MPSRPASAAYGAERGSPVGSISGRRTALAYPRGCIHPAGRRGRLPEGPGPSDSHHTSPTRERARQAKANPPRLRLGNELAKRIGDLLVPGHRSRPSIGRIAKDNMPPAVPVLNTPGTLIRRPSYQAPSRQYSRGNWWRMAFLKGRVPLLEKTRQINLEDSRFRGSGQRGRLARTPDSSISPGRSS
jgi:hypothetical protein